MARLSESVLNAFCRELEKTAVPAGLSAVGGALGRFGQRQLHSVTGWAPKGGLSAMKMAPTEAATSLPGFVRQVREKGLVGAVGAGAKHQLQNAGMTERALMVGLPALGVASELHRPDASAQGEKSKEERVGKQVGGLVGGLAGGAMPIAGGLVLGEGFGRAGAAVGRGVHRVRGALKNTLHPHGPHPTSTDPTMGQGQGVPTETVMSDRASGAIGGVA